MATCPIKSLPEWQELVIARGENVAYYLWDKYEGEVPSSEYNSAIVKSGLKSIDILSGDKAKQVFSVLLKNKVIGEPFWKKLQQDLAIPKDQIEILKSFNTYDREKLLTNLLAEYSFVVEVNTSMDRVSTQGSRPEDPNFQLGDYFYSSIIRYDDTFKYVKYKDYNDMYDKGSEITQQEYLEAKKEFKNVYEKTIIIRSTQHYPNLTVPGGTNYTENEISTPAITPSIKGHAQFATDKGIGWFRSDDRKDEIIPDSGFWDTESNEEPVWNDYKTKSIPKTRRILELQSDLFQKGRDKKDLITQTKVTSATNENFRGQANQEEYLNAMLYSLTEYEGYSQEEAEKQVEEERKRLLSFTSSKENTSENQFLQLLNKDSNWVTFFIKSIIQDSAKRGYEKVLFPKGETAAKIEGHETIAEEIRKIDNKINSKKETIEQRIKEQEGIADKIIETFVRLKQLDKVEKTKNDKSSVRPTLEKEIADLEQEKANLKSQGIEKLKPIEAFYEIKVGNILEKQYGKDNVKTITDEYGNEWREITIDKEREQQLIQLQIGEQPMSKASDSTLKKVKEAAKKMGIDIQKLSDYLKGVPNIPSGINALADLMRGVIAIAEGKEDVALIEEFVHIATTMLEQTHPEIITEMISKIDKFKIYKRTLEEYKNNKNYQNADGKPNIRKIKKEAVDKLIAELIVKQNEGDTEFPELMEETWRSVIRTWWSKILDFIKGDYRKANINIFEEVAKQVLTGEVGAKYYENVPIKEGVSELFESTPELANAVYEALGFNDKILSKVELKHKIAHVYDIIYNGKRIGNFELPLDLDGDSVLIGDVEIDKEYRGKGLGVETYKAAINLSSKPIESLIATDEANRVWESLVRQGLAKKTEDGYKSLKPQITPQQKQQAQQLYSQYLDSIGITDIAYHHSDEDISEFISSSERYFQKELKKKGRYIPKLDDIVFLVKKPLSEEFMSKRKFIGSWGLKTPKTLQFNAGEKIGEGVHPGIDEGIFAGIEGNYDAVDFGRIRDNKTWSEVIAITNPKNAIKLGSKQDIENFANFISYENSSHSKIGSIQQFRDYIMSKNFAAIEEFLVVNNKIDRKC